MADHDGATRESKFDDKTIKLYIGGISEEWDASRLKEILGSENGEDIKRVDIVHHYAFAFVKDQEAADRIIEQKSGKTFDGARIVIQVSKNKQNLPDGDNLCFECGNPGHWAKECAQRQERYRKRDEKAGRGGGGYRNGPPSHRGGDSYDRDPYARGSSYGRDPYARDPYARGSSYGRDPYVRDPYARDPYARDPYYERDSYYRDPYYRGYQGYRERSPQSYGQSRYSETDPYAEERRRLAYGTPSASSQTPTAASSAATSSYTAAAPASGGTYDYNNTRYTQPAQQQPTASSLPKQDQSQQYQQYYQQQYSQYQQKPQAQSQQQPQQSSYSQQPQSQQPSYPQQQYPQYAQKPSSYTS